MKQLGLFAGKRPKTQAMADVVDGWLELEEDSPRLAFINCKQDDLIKYHTSLGRDIRNHFSLWSYDWEPELRHGVDYSTEHPHQVSMRVIQEVWNRRQDAKKL